MTDKTLPATLSENIEPPWGLANPDRGISFDTLAKQFVHDFPVGSTLTTEKFDDWAQKKGAIKAPASSKKSSDGWMAYCQRRHRLHRKINLAGAHPRMEHPFVIESISLGIWEVRSPMAAIAKNAAARQIVALTNGKRRKLVYLMQSADWSLLPVYERIFAEALFDDINEWAREIQGKGNHLDNKFALLMSKIRQAVKDGGIVSRDGCIQRMLEGLDDDEEASDEDE